MSSPQTGGNQRELRKEATRRRVFEAALTVFRRDGIAGARVEDIVRIAEVSRGTFYFHFATKEAVVFALFAEQQVGIRDGLMALPTDASIEDVLTRLADIYAANWGGEAHLMLETGPIALRYAAQTVPSPPGVHPALDALVVRLRHARGPDAELRVPTDLAARMFIFNLLVGSLSWASQPDLTLRQALAPVVALFAQGLAH